MFDTTPTLTTPILANSTSTSAGQFGYDNLNFYSNETSSNKGVIPSIRFIRADSAVTLLNQSTVQPLFQSPTNGALTLPTGTYRFTTLINITSMSATSGNGTFSIQGTATIGSIMMRSVGFDAAPTTSDGGARASVAVTKSFSSPNMYTAGTSTAAWFEITGTFEVTGTGTIIPSYAMTTATASAAVGIGSYFECWCLGSTSVASVGNWS